MPENKLAVLVLVFYYSQRRDIRKFSVNELLERGFTGFEEIGKDEGLSE